VSPADLITAIRGGTAGLRRIASEIDDCTELPANAQPEDFTLAAKAAGTEAVRALLCVAVMIGQAGMLEGKTEPDS
jgi:hypothetical protein